MTSHEDAPVPAGLLPGAVKVIVYEGNVYTETGFTMYRSMPLPDMVKRRQPMPWASQWGDSITAWISTYVPLPRSTSEVPVAEEGLVFQSRTRTVRDCEQAVYRGWPLCTCGHDAPASPGGTSARPPARIPFTLRKKSVSVSMDHRTAWRAWVEGVTTRGPPRCWPVLQQESGHQESAERRCPSAAHRVDSAMTQGAERRQRALTDFSGASHSVSNLRTSEVHRTDLCST